MNFLFALAAALLTGAQITTTAATTSSPTAAPTKEVKYIGNGFCLDCLSKMYSMVKARFDKGEDCASWCLQHPKNLIGFVEEPNPAGEQGVDFCFCLFEGSGLPNNPMPDYTPPMDPHMIHNFTGTGPITVVKYLPNRPTAQCYIFTNVSANSTSSVHCRCIHRSAAHYFNIY